MKKKMEERFQILWIEDLSTQPPNMQRWIEKDPSQGHTFEILKHHVQN